MVMIAARRMALYAEGEGTRVVEPGWLRAEGGVIAEAGLGEPPSAPDLTLDHGVLAPGLVDIQVNGFFGYDMADADREGWRTVVRRLPETGVTAFVPTFITEPVPELARAVREARELTAGLDQRGARVLGLHLEGPFISPKRKGAHNPDWMVDPTPENVDALLEAGEGFLRYVTLAPERDGSMDAIKRFTAAGVMVSVGHTDATAAQVKAAADMGARKVTHLFNAQRPLHHREPGVPGHALYDPRLTCGLIADLHHVDAEVCAVVFAAAPGRVCIVTDAASSAGMPPGEYVLGGEPVTQPEDGPPLRADGAFAGSALTMDKGVANMVRAGIDLATAIDAATRVPADLIGSTEIGRIAVGAAADLVWLGDDLRAQTTWVDGEIVFDRSATS
ncbi:N-acetylglucosamine-6-phosphate deacetylase [Bailinhaonella thermotolerans]|uniref:N-acetylglucosamine-6-phosphate deacetylase n=1 Tax=Bailinhaonella thermotolerans TaxID=1070861 RepID=A0A3A4B8J6_9ACTN|nr:N-acetylglucosamine-6-phosphate deacetylase [Bailinhaonella thermotolerans]RJL30448.1 N-acetylglucosamine-6-phosphate deacetylase [Bailinhaonella thermotolerans]